MRTADGDDVATQPVYSDDDTPSTCAAMTMMRPESIHTPDDNDRLHSLREQQRQEHPHGRQRYLVCARVSHPHALGQK